MTALTTTLSTTSPPAGAPPLGLPAWAPWTLILLGAVMLVTWWTGSKRAKVTTVRSEGPSDSFAKRLLRSANAAQSAAEHPGAGAGATSTLDDDTARLVDDLCARLDERAARIESLLHDAKATIARLEALQSSTPAPSPSRSKRAPKNAAAEPPLVEVIAPAQSSVRAAQSPADPLCARVYQLADSGADAVEIAKQLSEHTGKVQLILALRGQ